MHPTQNFAAAVSSASSHSSGSQSSLFGGSGVSYGNHPAEVRPAPSRAGSTPQFRQVVSNPAEYMLPGVGPGAHILYAIASARVYHSTQLTSNHSGTLSFGRGHGSSKNKNNGSQWVYSHLKGTLVFGQDKNSGTSETTTVEQIVVPSRNEGGPKGDWWFQLVDDEAGRVVWKFKIPLSAGAKFNYELDRPFFHVFQGSSRKYGFLFDDDKEAATFLGEVDTRTACAIAAMSKVSKNRSRSLSIKSNKKSKPRESSSSPLSPPYAGVSASMISSPTPDSFKHLAHIGLNQTNGTIETSKDLDPSFREILADLRMQTGSNVTESVVLEHLDFIQGFWKDIDTIQRGINSRPVVAN